MRSDTPRTAVRHGRFSLAHLLVLVLAIAGCGTPTEQPTTEPDPAADTVEVQVFFGNDQLGDPCDEVFAVSRTVDADDPVTGALAALLAGPTTAERADGYGGWFSDDTTGMLHGVTVDADGTAHVVFADLRPVIPNASTSCGSAALLAQLDQTLLAFDHIGDTRYAIADQAAFYAWLQLVDPDAPAPIEPEPDDTDDDPATEDAAAAEDGPATQEGPATDDGTTADDEGSSTDTAGDRRGSWRWGDPTATGRGVAVNCCDIPNEGPPSPPGPLPETGWPADGFYAVGIGYLDGPGSKVRLSIGRWERCDLLPDGACPEHWPPDALEAEEARTFREVPLDALDVSLWPMRSIQDEDREVLYGTAPAFAELLHDDLGPAFRTWVIEPYQAGEAEGAEETSRAIEEDLRSRSADQDFPFGTLPDDDGGETYDQLGYRGPLGSLLVVSAWDPERLPEEFYWWRFPSLEIRDGRPILHVTADGYYG
jgi:hypothetical protein